VNFMDEKLTVLIPCKNESRNIRRCIESARQVADEVLVADCCSEDDTLTIVAQMGACRVIQKGLPNFAAFKNWAIPQARYPWVLILDADERLTPELAREIKQFLRNPPEHFDAYTVPRLLFFLGHPLRLGGLQNDRPIRLIRRDLCRYKPCRVHESIPYDRRRVGTFRHGLLHFSYRSYNEYFAKNVRYTEWAALDAWERGRRTGFANLLLRPLLRFLQLYLLRLGILDGLAGLQWCMLSAFFNSFVKQARLWELQYGLVSSEAEQPTYVVGASQESPDGLSAGELDAFPPVHVQAQWRELEPEHVTIATESGGAEWADDRIGRTAAVCGPDQFCGKYDPRVPGRTDLQADVLNSP
jgi:glycosyltransferase involved in cell wall biosynthesis